MKYPSTLLIGICALLVLSACGAPAESSGEALPSAPSSAVSTPDSSEQMEATEPSQPVEEADTETPDIGASAPQEQPAASQTVEEPDSTNSGEEPTEPVEQIPAPSEPNTADSSSEPDTTASNILIAYFTWADNTVVSDPAAVDVDATTSASVLAPGHVAQMAGWIQEATGGDLFSMQVTEPYSSDYDQCLDRAADEKAENARPALSTSVSNMEDYDVVFLGYPDWWATCPMAVFTFLDSYDFTGKTVIPFCAHGTSGLAASVRDIRAALPDVTVLDAVGVQRPGMDTPLDTAEATVQEWLDELGY